MRSDYGLYIVAVICFVLAAIFASSMVSGYELSTASGITVTVVFSLIGIIALAVGYSARPKALMPPSEPAPAPVVSAPMVEPTPMVEEPAEPSTPPVPATVEEISVSAEPVATAPAEPSEPSPPVVEMRAEPETPQAPSMETSASAEVAPEEKPKPARRRRKKATA
jgi:hypothetical protein